MRTCAQASSIRAMPENEIPPAMRVDIYFYDKNVKMPYVIQNREYYGLKDFRLVMRI